MDDNWDLYETLYETEAEVKKMNDALAEEIKMNTELTSLCNILKARFKLLEDYVKNLKLQDPEGSYEIGWNAACEDILSEVRYWQDGLQTETNRVPQRSIRKD